MIIGFHMVVPAPLPVNNSADTDIWKKECTFEPGLCYNVVAPSGKGKTTFIHLLYGLRFDYEGEVTLDGKNAKALSSDAWTEIRKDHLSIVYQDLRLFLHLTARENICVKSALYQNTSAVKIDEMADELNVAHVLANPCHTLSYGERQRVAIIRSLIQPFDWLLLDEPFSHLDVENASKAAALIGREVAARKAGLVVTSLGWSESFTYTSRFRL